MPGPETSSEQTSAAADALPPCPALLAAHRRVVAAHGGIVTRSSVTPDDLDVVCLFGDTVEPVAAEVRLRMLRHIGVVPDPPTELDADRLASLPLATLTPTDLWLVASTASSVTAPMPGLAALAGHVTEERRCDAVSTIRSRYGAS